jgi:hypothetical protein
MGRGVEHAEPNDRHHDRRTDQVRGCRRGALPWRLADGPSFLSGLPLQTATADTSLGSIVQDGGSELVSRDNVEQVKHEPIDRQIAPCGLAAKVGERIGGKLKLDRRRRALRFGFDFGLGAHCKMVTPNGDDGQAVESAAGRARSTTLGRRSAAVSSRW